jgi:hypothetical protein
MVRTRIDDGSASAGFDAHLVKPVDIDRLTRLLLQMLEPSGTV